MNDDDNWIPITASALAAFARAVNLIDGESAVSAETTRVKPLPFYRDTVLVRVGGPDRPGSATYYLDRKGVFSRLDGSSVPIHEVNALEPVKLNEGNVLDYLGFFCRFVHGDEGAFNLLREAHELSELHQIDGKAHAELAGMVRPPSLLSRSSDDDSFLCEGFVLYGNDLFKAQFSVTPFGMVHMISDELVSGFKKDTDTRPTTQEPRSQQPRPKF